MKWLNIYFTTYYLSNYEIYEASKDICVIFIVSYVIEGEDLLKHPTFASQHTYSDSLKQT